MNETLTGFAALALLGFIAGFGMLMLFMVLVQPIWSLVDCAIDPKRGTPGKILWVLALILMWGVANWFYGAFAAANKALRNLTRLAWALAIGLAIAFAVMFYQHAEFRRGIERQWQEHGGVLTTRAAPSTLRMQLGNRG
jgi:ABC-type amino acid transport system permease subunit